MKLPVELYVLASLMITALLVLVIFAIYAIFFAPAATPREIPLRAGPHVWEVYVGGDRQEWHLAYESYDDLPMHNIDYDSVVTFNGRRYTLWRVFSNQIRVSPEIHNQPPETS